MVNGYRLNVTQWVGGTVYHGAHFFTKDTNEFDWWTDMIAMVASKIDHGLLEEAGCVLPTREWSMEFVGQW